MKNSVGCNFSLFFSVMKIIQNKPHIFPFRAFLSNSSLGLCFVFEHVVLNKEATFINSRNAVEDAPWLTRVVKYKNRIQLFKRNKIIVKKIALFIIHYFICH